MSRPNNSRLWALTLIALILSIPMASTADEIVDRIIAIVNDDIISLYELNQEILPYLEKIKSQNTTLAQQRRQLFKVREERLRQLIEERMADQEIKRLGLKVGDQEVDAAIERIKTANKHSDDDFQKILTAQGISMDVYRKQVKGQLLRAKLVNREVRSKIVITEEEIKDYYRKNLAEFGAQKKTHLRNIVKTNSPGSDADQKQQTAQTMAEIYAQLRQGGSFEKLAQRHSDAPNASDGGDLGLIAEEMLAPRIREALAVLKPGQFTPVLETELGLQIFYVQKVQTSDATPLEQVKPKIEEKLYNDFVNRSYRAWVEELKHKSHIKLIR